MVLLVIVGCLAIVAFGAVVAIALVVGRLRARRLWSGPGMAKDEMHGDFEDPAGSGAVPLGQSTTDATAFGQAQRNHLGNSPGAGGAGFGSLGGG